MKRIRVAFIILSIVMLLSVMYCVGCEKDSDNGYIKTTVETYNSPFDVNIVTVSVKIENISDQTLTVATIFVSQTQGNQIVKTITISAGEKRTVTNEFDTRRNKPIYKNGSPQVQFVVRDVGGNIVYKTI